MLVSLNCRTHSVGFHHHHQGLSGKRNCVKGGEDHDFNHWTNNTGYIQKEEKPAVYSEIFSEVQATEILLTVGRT